MREKLKTEQNCSILTPHSYGHNCVSFPFSWAAQLGAHSVECWFSLPHLISNWLNFLCTELYNSSTSTFLWASQIALIQPVHGQGNILIFLDRMHLLFTQVYFLFWQSGRVGGQYIINILHRLLFYIFFSKLHKGRLKRELSRPVERALFQIFGIGGLGLIACLENPHARIQFKAWQINSLSLVCIRLYEWTGCVRD